MRQPCSVPNQPTGWRLLCPMVVIATGARTELSGIKWRKLTWSEPGGGSHGPGHGIHHVVPGEPLDDPVLRSYSRCLAADILCVWRRVSGCSGSARPPPDAFEPPPPPAQPPPLSLASAKELWIFWYGEEPDLNELVAPELNMTVDNCGIDCHDEPDWFK
ncbi:hypothetical protein HUJ05_010150 [Dendroctonus ponderosae]|nr:hypothetical protein HUJ05_010150 [Dendroctonus ponderosae]